MRLVVLDQRAFEQQSLEVSRCDQHLEVGDLAREGVGLAVELLRRHEVVGDAAAQHLGLANVDHPAAAVFHQVAAGLFG